MAERSGRDAGSEWRSFRSLLVGRAVTCLAILASILGISAASGFRAALGPIVALMLVSLALTFPYFLLGRRLPSRLRAIGLFVVVVDTLSLTLGEHLLGGANAFFGLPLYGILIVMAATLHSPRAAFGVALLGSGSFAAMVGATYFGWIAEREPLITPSLMDDWQASTVLINALLGIAMALVASMLSSLKDDAIARSQCAERELLAVNAGLEQRVEQAIAAEKAARESLERQNSELSATLRQVNLFAGAVSHDLRNPITAAGEALRLSRQRGERGREQLLDLAAENLGRVDRMVIGLRDLMRTVGSRSPARRIEVQPLLERIREELRIQNFGKTVPVELATELGEVEGDADHLTHLFRNLISNALRHNEDRGDLRISVSRRALPDRVEFSVCDNGRGIPNEVRERIFEPFYRGQTQSSGLGLGLALAAAIVNQAGGTIWVEAALGGGTALRFTWPTAGRERS